MVNPLVILGRSFEPTVRSVSHLKNVIYDTNWLSNAPELVLYYFFRGVCLDPHHQKIMDENSIRYDITIIPPNTLGIEYTKTLGHYHPKVPGSSISYPEMYQVISGKGFYLLQKEESGRIVDVVIIRAEAGDIIVIPPDYGHVTINESNETLKMCNWVSPAFTSIYDIIERRRGGAYYNLVGGRIVPNMNYGTIPTPRFVSPFKKEFFGVTEDIYELVANPEILEFINRPEKHENLFRRALA